MRQVQQLRRRIVGVVRHDTVRMRHRS
jgi:hypothetical protein